MYFYWLTPELRRFLRFIGYDAPDDAIQIFSNRLLPRQFTPIEVKQ